MNEYEYTKRLIELENKIPLCHDHRGDTSLYRFDPCLMCKVEGLRLRNKQLANDNAALKIMMRHIFKMMRDAQKYNRTIVLTKEDNEFDDGRSLYYRSVNYISTKSYNEMDGVVIATVYPDLRVDIVGF